MNQHRTLCDSNERGVRFYRAELNDRAVAGLEKAGARR